MYNPAWQGSRVMVTRGLPYYARFWLPSHDHPTDAATTAVTLHVPDGTLGASNGLLVGGDYTLGSGLDPAGRRVFRWRSERPIPPYLMNVAIGDYSAYSEEVCYGVANGVGNVVGMMPHPERLADPVLGADAGHRFFASLMQWGADVR